MAKETRRSEARVGAYGLGPGRVRIRRRHPGSRPNSAILWKERTRPFPTMRRISSVAKILLRQERKPGEAV